MNTRPKPKPRRPWQEVWPSFANRQSLQDLQDEHDLEMGWGKRRVRKPRAKTKKLT